VLYALLFLPALVAIAFVVLRPRPRVLAEAVPEPPELTGEIDPIAALDALLAELEQTTVRIDGADELDEDAVTRLEQLAERLEAAAASLVGVG
jgi:predicted transcriptional regulator